MVLHRIRVQLTNDGYQVDIDTDTEAVLRLRGMRFADTGSFDGTGLSQPSGGFKKATMWMSNSAFQMPACLTHQIGMRIMHGAQPSDPDRLAGRSAAKRVLAMRLKPIASVDSHRQWPLGTALLP